MVVGKTYSLFTNLLEELSMPRVVDCMCTAYISYFVWYEPELIKSVKAVPNT